MLTSLVLWHSPDMRAIPQEIFKISIAEISLEIINIKSQLHLPWANELWVMTHKTLKSGPGAYLTAGHRHVSAVPRLGQTHWKKLALYGNNLGTGTQNVCRMSSIRRVSVLDLGAVSIRKTVLPGMAIPMLKIRRHNGRLIFNMEIAIRR